MGVRLWKTSERLERGNTGYGSVNESMIYWMVGNVSEKEGGGGGGFPALKTFFRQNVSKTPQKVFIYVSCVVSVRKSRVKEAYVTTKMVVNMAWKRREIQLLTKMARWGEQKGQCGESEREREKQMAAERILLGTAGSMESQKMSAEKG